MFIVPSGFIRFDRLSTVAVDSLILGTQQHTIQPLNGHDSLQCCSGAQVTGVGLSHLWLTNSKGVGTSPKAMPPISSADKNRMYV